MARKADTLAGWRELMQLQIVVRDVPAAAEHRCAVWSPAPLAMPGQDTPWRDKARKTPAADIECLWALDEVTGRIFWVAVLADSGTVLDWTEYVGAGRAADRLSGRAS